MKRGKRLNVRSIMKNNPNKTTSETYRQYKIHRSQMSKIDLQILSKQIKQSVNRSTSISGHTEEKGFDCFNIDVFRKIILKRGLEDRIVEYSEKPTTNGVKKLVDKRVLIRDSYTNQKDICFVYSLTKNIIVTAYWNDSKDNHDTLNWGRYKSNLYISV